ncbi:MAG TPA: PP2C family protein-serine/threonine phosphatase [Terracidiphilus sp.]|nr:PP2C family protein-serine/threonine phosphatase [Terracidiphilus sp.]
MLLSDTLISARDVLKIVQQDEPALFLGSAFMTVGIVTEAFCLLRRRFDELMVWLGMFAFLYGFRMWLDTGLLHLSFENQEFFKQLRWAANFTVPVPAFLFFQSSGLLARRGKAVTVLLSAVFLSLAAAVFVAGRLPVLHTINNALVIAALPWVVLRTFLLGKRDHDFVVLRWGLVCFVALVLWDNTLGPRLLRFSIEPYGFAVLLGCLGYVAARRTLARDEALREIQSELEIARNIQVSILPGDFPESTSFRVAAKYVPMTAVAGDFYDFLATDAKHAGLLIADVSGHGVPAALIASMVKMSAAAQRGSADKPAELLRGMNASLCGNTQGQYVTAAYAYLDAQARELRYAAAGHPSLLLLRAGRVVEVTENGLLLAAAGDAVYTEVSVGLEPGDRLLLYTDGLLEAKNAGGEMFGEALLSAALQKTSKLPPGEAVELILGEVQRWARAQEDDLTALVCDFVEA